MVLTSHQLFHLNAVLKEAKFNKLLSSKEKLILTSSKQIKLREEDSYYDKCISDVETIIKEGKFPNLKDTSMIHDYIEKETKGEFR